MKADLQKRLELEAGGQSYPLFVCGPGTSSLDAAWEFIDEGSLPVWGAVLMESQSGGRGRMGRAWQSPPGHVYGALRLPEEPPFDGPGASLALACFLMNGLREMGAAVRIKWPNDLIYETEDLNPQAGREGKTGGILLESKSKGLIAGVGLNLMAPPEGDWIARRESGAPRPGALPFSQGPLAVWSELVRKVIISYNKGLGLWSISRVAAEAEKFLFWLERPVRVITPASEPPAPPSGLSGRIIGLAPDGCLRLRNESGLYKLWSGTVCLL